eukprot:TRINITY_DN4722_c1_g1_i1.p2 TRINITY_DN4722_c1_g1~~TRINITY_DN4722_c1_g1_i1.p2  ORF type:complete len:158 (+),score=34.43 TRINITY_DN4722_c1_g1_i1:66-476(+)
MQFSTLKVEKFKNIRKIRVVLRRFLDKRKCVGFTSALVSLAQGVSRDVPDVFLKNVAYKWPHANKQRKKKKKKKRTHANIEEPLLLRPPDREEKKEEKKKKKKKKKKENMVSLLFPFPSLFYPHLFPPSPSSFLVT